MLTTSVRLRNFTSNSKCEKFAKKLHYGKQYRDKIKQMCMRETVIVFSITYQMIYVQQNRDRCSRTKILSLFLIKQLPE